MIQLVPFNFGLEFCKQIGLAWGFRLLSIISLSLFLVLFFNGLNELTLLTNDVASTWLIRWQSHKLVLFVRQMIDQIIFIVQSCQMWLGCCIINYYHLIITTFRHLTYKKKVKNDEKLKWRQWRLDYMFLEVSCDEEAK